MARQHDEAEKIWGEGLAELSAEEKKAKVDYNKAEQQFNASSQQCFEFFHRLKKVGDETMLMKEHGMWAPLQGEHLALLEKQITVQKTLLPLQKTMKDALAWLKEVEWKTYMASVEYTDMIWRHRKEKNELVATHIDELRKCRDEGFERVLVEWSKADAKSKELCERGE